MKVNAPMLFHHMQKYFQVFYEHSTQNNYVKTPIFYSHFFNMDEHIVLVSSDNLTDCMKLVNRAVVICLDKPETIPDCGSNDLIILDDTMADAMTFNILNHVLDEFADWDTALNRILIKNMNFLDLVNAISDMLELPCALLDHDFGYVAYSDNSIENIQYVDNQNQLNTESVSKLLAQEDFEKLEQIQEAFYYDPVHPTIVKNIYSAQTYVGRLTALLKDTPEDIEYYKAIFDHAAFYIESLYALSNSFDNTQSQYRQIHNCLEQLLDHAPINRDLLRSVLTEAGYQEEDRWKIICLTSSDRTKAIYSPAYICSQIEHNWPGHFCIRRGDMIYILSNNDLFHRQGHTGIHKQFHDYVAQTFLNAGISRGFKNILNNQTVTCAVKQAEYALDKGCTIARKRGFCTFDEVALSYLLENGADEFPFELICHPAIIRLAAHDKKHNTLFTMTLYTYIRKRMNAVAAAKALYIHRSSFINRMKRIEELTDLNFDDYEDILYLEICFQIFKDVVKDTLVPS